MMGGDGEGVEDTFEEILALVDEFDRADLSDITQRRSDYEWSRLLDDYKQISKDIKNCCWRRSEEIKENDEKVSEITAEESQLKEENSSLKREIGRVRTQFESVADSLIGQKRTIEGTLAALEQQKAAVKNLEITNRGIRLSQALIRRKLKSPKLAMKQCNAIAVSNPSEGTVEYIGLDPKKEVHLEVRPIKGADNTPSYSQSSAQPVGSSQQGNKENEEVSHVDETLDSSEMECE